MSPFKTFAMTLVLGASFTALADDWTGTVQPKPADAKPGVVAVLHPKSKTKDAKDAKDVNLIATGDTAAKLEEYAQRHALVKISGSVKDDGVHVEKVSDVAATTKKKSKK